MSVSELDIFATYSPSKENCFLYKINGGYSLEETENSGVFERRMILELGLG